MTSIPGNERQTDERDIGFAIRDFCEGFYISHFHEEKVADDEAELTEHACADMVESVDVSEPDEPVIHMLNGAVFKVRIVRTS